MSNTEKIIKYKTSINKIKASTLKELGFKSKTIAKNFAKLTNVNPKEYSNEELLLKALKNKLSMFQKLGLEFNFIKSFDYSSPKVKENRKKKQEKKYNETLEKLNKIENSFEQKFHIKIISDNNVDYFFKSEITEKSLEKTSDHYLKFRDFKMPVNKNYIPWEKTQHTRKKTVFLPFNYDIYKNDLTQFKSYLYQIYNDQKFTFKLTFEFSFLLVLSEDARIVSESEKKKNPELKKYKYKLMYNLFYPSTNTRLDSFENPVVVDNKNDIESIISKVKKEDLIEKVTTKVANNSAWQFYKFLGIAFHIYEMNTPIGKANELPIHFKQGSNKIAESYKGIEYVAYDKEYNDEALDNDEYDKKNDEIDLIEKHFNVNVNVYTHDEPELLQIDRRSICNYDDTLNLMRYNNHFMYIKDLKQIRHCYRCKKCSKIFKNMEACNRHEKTCDELV